MTPPPSPPLRSLPGFFWGVLTAGLISQWAATAREAVGFWYLVPATAIVFVIAIWMAPRSKYASAVQRFGPWMAAAAYIAFLGIAKYVELPTVVLIVVPALATSVLLILLVIRSDQDLVLIAIAGIGLGIALIGAGIAGILDNNTILGIASIGLGIALIGLGIGSILDNNTILGTALIGLGIAGIGLGIRAQTPSLGDVRTSPHPQRTHVAEIPGGTSTSPDCFADK